MTNTEIKDVILAWAVRKRILLGQDSIDDLTKAIIHLEGIQEFTCKLELCPRVTHYKKMNKI